MLPLAGDVDDRLVLAAPRSAGALRAPARARRVRRLSPLGVRERRARPRAPPERADARTGRRSRAPPAHASSCRCASASRRRCDRVQGWLELYPTLRFKLDATSDWTDELVARAARARLRRLRRLQGPLHGDDRRPGRRPGALPARHRRPPGHLARGPEDRRRHAADPRGGRRRRSRGTRSSTRSRTSRRCPGRRRR